MRRIRHLINLLFILAVIAQISLVQLRAFCDLSHLATHSMETKTSDEHVTHTKAHKHQHSHAGTNPLETVKESHPVHSHDESESSSTCCNEVGSTDCQISGLFELDHSDTKLLTVYYGRTRLPIFNSISRNLIISAKTQDPPNLICHRTTVLII